MMRQATIEDAPIIHEVMLAAFKKYETDPYPSSALQESISSIEEAMRRGQEALLYEEDGRYVGMVRYEWLEDALYFRRLSVLPSMQGRGIAKKIVRQLEVIAKEGGKRKLACRVRKSEKGNLQLYTSIGFDWMSEEWYDQEGGPMLIVKMEKELMG